MPRKTYELYQSMLGSPDQFHKGAGSGHGHESTVLPGALVTAAEPLSFVQEMWGAYNAGTFLEKLRSMPVHSS